MKNAEIYAAITEKIITNLEQAGSWTKLWNVPPPVNLNGRSYRGVNRLTLAADNYKSRVYGTFQQIRSNGGSVRRGEKATIIVFWKRELVTDEKTGEKSLKFLLRYYHVFNTEQADFDQIGKEKIDSLNCEAHSVLIDLPAEEIISGFQDCPELIFSTSDDDAFYNPVTDLVSVPDRRFFVSVESFYRAVFHELAHSTGHPKRLNRFETGTGRFGDEKYSKEELVAELCSSFLCGIAGLNKELTNSAAYIRGWSSVLKENTKWILWAASRAERAAEYILGREESNAPDQSPEPATVTAD